MKYRERNTCVEMNTYDSFYFQFFVKKKNDEKKLLYKNILEYKKKIKNKGSYVCMCLLKCRGGG